MYHLGLNVIIWDERLSSGTNVIIWDYMLSSGTTCYYLGLHVIIWDAMLSSGANVIIWDKMLSSGANVIMVSSGANVIIWCYHVMLSSGMITHPFFIFPENFTHSPQIRKLPHLRKVCKYTKFCKSANLLISDLLICNLRNLFTDRPPLISRPMYHATLHYLNEDEIFI